MRVAKFLAIGSCETSKIVFPAWVKRWRFFKTTNLFSSSNWSKSLLDINSNTIQTYTHQTLMYCIKVPTPSPHFPFFYSFPLLPCFSLFFRSRPLRPHLVGDVRCTIHSVTWIPRIGNVSNVYINGAVIYCTVQYNTTSKVPTLSLSAGMWGLVVGSRVYEIFSYLIWRYKFY